ncbi:uncharacterized protein LOC126672735 [Mercurialis annua]|uniref:uncharacterized protein LOC126672735 n=1 Tax=Mercurialis annua TaxID=3986 RepID=UPI00215FA720|nr:uncharacterized protein LOC126672735 [Mercurialis annua]
MAQPVIPRFVVLRSNGDKYLRYTKEGEYVKYVKCEGNDILDPLSKFRVEKSKSNQDLVHIRCCYNNKYVARIDASTLYIGAASDAVEEDQSKWSCTLFKPVLKDGVTYRFQHVQTGNNLCHLRTGGAANDHCLAVQWSGPDKNGWDLFTFTDWESLVILPKHVAVKGDNGKYLFYRGNGDEHMEFGATDIGDSRIGEQIFTNPDGSIRLKHDSNGKFWGAIPNWIYPDSSDESDSNPATSFWPVKIKGNAIALRNKGNDRYLRRTNYGGTVDCLAAASSATTIDKESYLVLEELVNKREIYDVEYRLDDARVYNESIMTLARSCVTNMTQETETLEVTMSYNQESMYTVTTGTSSSSSFSIKFSIGIPEIAEESVEINKTTESDYEWGTTVNSSTTLTKTVPVSVNPMTKTTLTLVATLGFCDVPFSYTQTDTLTNGQRETTAKNDGLFSGANCFKFRTEASDEPL